MRPTHDGNFHIHLHDHRPRPLDDPKEVDRRLFRPALRIEMREQSHGQMTPRRVERDPFRQDSLERQSVERGERAGLRVQVEERQRRMHRQPTIARRQERVLHIEADDPPSVRRNRELLGRSAHRRRADENMADPTLSIRVPSHVDDGDRRCLRPDMQIGRAAEPVQIGRDEAPSVRSPIPDALALLARAESAIANARDIDRGRGGEATLGLIGAATFEAMPRLIAALAARSPGVSVRFREMTANEQFAALREGAIDAGMVRAEARAQGLSFKTVLREPVVCLLPERHPLAAREAVRIADLEGEPILNLARAHDPAGHDFYLSLYRTAGFEPNVVREASQIATILFLIAATGCLALGPAGWRVLRREGVTLRPLTDEPAPVAETRLVWNPKRVSRALEAVLNAAF